MFYDQGGPCFGDPYFMMRIVHIYYQGDPCFMMRMANVYD